MYKVCLRQKAKVSRILGMSNSYSYYIDLTLFTGTTSRLLVQPEKFQLPFLFQWMNGFSFGLSFCRKIRQSTNNDQVWVMTRTLHFTAQHNYCSLKEAKVLRYFTYLSKMHLTHVSFGILSSVQITRKVSRNWVQDTKICFRLILSSPEWDKQYGCCFNCCCDSHSEPHVEGQYLK